jgi:hypothetical protein
MRTRRYLVVILVAIAIILSTFACDILIPTTPTETEPPPTDTSVPSPTDTSVPSLTDTPLPPPTDTPEPTIVPLGSISGVLWHEICESTGGHAGEPLVLGLGCVEWDGGIAAGNWGPNQIHDPFEVGWEGVTLHLGAGACPSTGLATTMTNIDGEYSFTDLPAGTYCVSYDALTDGNDVILLPGGPTYPVRGDAGYFWTIELADGVDETGWNFGFAWQFYN